MLILLIVVVGGGAAAVDGDDDSAHAKTLSDEQMSCTWLRLLILQFAAELSPSTWSWPRDVCVFIYMEQNSLDMRGTVEWRGTVSSGTVRLALR